MAKKREERVKDKLKKYREKLKGIKPVSETKRKLKPIVNQRLSALEINNKKLVEMSRRHIEEIEFKEKNKVNLDEHFAKLKEESKQIAEVFDVEAE